MSCLALNNAREYWLVLDTQPKLLPAVSRRSFSILVAE